ncbi:putative MFS-type transporter EfpA [Streptomyces sp. enrichment culture]
MRDTTLSLNGAMSGLGVVLGLLLGGVLADTLGWRWVFFINNLIGLLFLLASRNLVTAGRHHGRDGATDAVLGIGAMVALVYAITRFGEDGFTDPAALALLAAGTVLLVMFVRTQARSTAPLVLRGLLRVRNRSGAYLTVLLLAIGPMGSPYIITLYFQRVQHFSPLLTGVAWLPFAAGLILGAGTAPKLLMRQAPRLLAAPGALLSTLAALWLSALRVETHCGCS